VRPFELKEITKSVLLGILRGRSAAFSQLKQRTLGRDNVHIQRVIDDDRNSRNRKPLFQMRYKIVSMKSDFPAQAGEPYIN